MHCCPSRKASSKLNLKFALCLFATTLLRYRHAQSHQSILPFLTTLAFHSLHHVIITSSISSLYKSLPSPPYPRHPRFNEFNPPTKLTHSLPCPPFLVRLPRPPQPPHNNSCTQQPHISSSTPTFYYPTSYFPPASASPIPPLPCIVTYM